MIVAFTTEVSGEPGAGHIADKDERAKLGDAAAAVNAHRHADAGIELPTPRAWSY